jgi:hypothetical protein
MRTQIQIQKIQHYGMPPGSPVYGPRISGEMAQAKFEAMFPAGHVPKLDSAVKVRRAS